MSDFRALSVDEIGNHEIYTFLSDPTGWTKPAARATAAKILQVLRAHVPGWSLDAPGAEPTAAWEQPHALSEEAQAVRSECEAIFESALPMKLHFLARRVIALIDAHANDLTDMSRNCEEFSKVYEHIAGLSKANTAAMYVIDAHDKAVDEAYEEGKRDALGLEWSSDKPTRPGAYWARRRREPERPFLAHVEADSGMLVARTSRFSALEVSALAWDWCALPEAPP